MRSLFEISVRERLVIMIIVINSLIIFLRGFPSLESSFGSVLESLDHLCTVYFIYEALVKISLLRVRGYFASAWNRFDFVIVALSVPMLLGPVLGLEDYSYLLLLRLARLLRFLRLLRFIPDVERVVAGLKRGLRASVGVFLGLGLYTFILGLASCYLFREMSPENFGDPFLGIYSIFKVFTVEGWFEIADEMATNFPAYGFVIRAYFIFAVATGGLLGLSLANAVFVDEMMADNNLALERQVADLQSALEKISSDQQLVLRMFQDAPKK